MALQDYLKPLPFCAVLRGITPQETPAVADALVAEGFRILEVPLNSPQPFDSIRLLAQRCKDALVGAGTVLRVEDVARVREAGGNVIVIRHQGVPGVFATRYDHLKKSSVSVKPGDTVKRGQKIAEAASAGNSTGPHLHFEVWGTGFYELADPWAGPCGPNRGPSLWAYDPPWSG